MLKTLLTKVQNRFLNAKAWVSKQSRSVKIILAVLLVLELLFVAKVCLGASILSLL